MILPSRLASSIAARIISSLCTPRPSSEKAIASAEEEAEQLEAQLADPATYQDADKAAQLAKAYQQKKDEIDLLYQKWEALEMEE